jgi:transposase
MRRRRRHQCRDQLKAILVRADPTLRESLAALSTRRLIRRCTELTSETTTDITTASVIDLFDGAPLPT